MSKFFDTTSDRRHAPRTKLVEIAYIGMGPENGGLVLDVSDGGLSFHSVAPVQPAETIRFLLSLRGHSRIEGAGEVVWTNEMRTVCGLKFTSLSAGAREHLNNWTNQSQMSAVALEEPSLSFHSADGQAEEEQATTVTETEPQSDAEIDASPEIAILRAGKVPFSGSSDTTLWQAPLFVKFMFALLAVGVATAAFLYGIQVGKSQSGPGTRSVAASGPQTGTSTLSPASVAASPAAVESAPAPAATSSSLEHAASIPASPNAMANVTTSNPTTTLTNASTSNAGAASNVEHLAVSDGRPVSASHGPSAADLRAQQDAGKAELAAALSYLNGEHGERDSAKAVQQLWSAVRDGNSDAEVVLSDLFVAGDGVQKNCEQGRILLSAASKTGNPAARVKLDELLTNGCE